MRENHILMENRTLHLVAWIYPGRDSLQEFQKVLQTSSQIGEQKVHRLTTIRLGVME